MSRGRALASLLLLAGCRRTDETPAALLSTVKEHLAERDRALAAFELSGRTEERGQVATFRFAHRAPNRLRGDLLAPRPRSLAFDGQRLCVLAPEAQRLDCFNFAISEQAASLLLTRLFAPFAAEGYRAPLVRSEGLTAAREGEAVRLTQRVEGGEVSYLLRWPALDFLEKRVGTAVDRVDREQCEAGRCVPTRIRHLEHGREVGVTTYDEVRLNPELPAARFELVAPAGYAASTRALTDPSQLAE